MHAKRKQALTRSIRFCISLRLRKDISSSSGALHMRWKVSEKKNLTIFMYTPFQFEFWREKFSIGSRRFQLPLYLHKLGSVFLEEEN